MRVLIACEFSGIVRDAFRARGHDAWSCDILPCESDPAYHIQGDALALLGNGWDLLIAHPPCTMLSNSGARWMVEREGRWQDMDNAAWFFQQFLAAPIPRVAVENPWPHTWAISLLGRPQCKAQPFWFGDYQKKGLCLWLKGLPPLLPDQYVGPPPPPGSEEAKEWEAVWREPPGPNQAHNRSRTFPGFARAMATQWGTLPPLLGA